MVIIQHSNFKYSRLYQNYQETVPVINIPSLVCSWNSSWVTICHISYINQFRQQGSKQLCNNTILLRSCWMSFYITSLYMYYCMLYFTLLYFMYICAFDAFSSFLFCIYLILASFFKIAHVHVWFLYWILGGAWSIFNTWRLQMGVRDLISSKYNFLFHI